jgi:hypothetical protein
VGRESILRSAQAVVGGGLKGYIPWVRSAAPNDAVLREPFSWMGHAVAQLAPSPPQISLTRHRGRRGRHRGRRRGREQAQGQTQGQAQGAPAGLQLQSTVRLLFVNYSGREEEEEEKKQRQQQQQQHFLEA